MNLIQKCGSKSIKKNVKNISFFSNLLQFRQIHFKSFNIHKLNINDLNPLKREKKIIEKNQLRFTKYLKKNKKKNRKYRKKRNKIEVENEIENFRKSFLKNEKNIIEKNNKNSLDEEINDEKISEELLQNKKNEQIGKKTDKIDKLVKNFEKKLKIKPQKKLNQIQSNKTNEKIKNVK